MDFTRIFSLKSRPTFFLLVAALCIFSVGAWWSVRLLVWSELEGRLHSNADRIEASLREQLMTHGNNLVHIRAHFLLHGIPDQAGFHRIVNQIELLSRYPGVRGVGFAKLVRSIDRNDFNVEMGKKIPGYKPILRGVNNINLPISMVEPLDWQNQRSIGVDMLAETLTRKAIDLALETGEVALSSPMHLGPDSEPNRAGFLLFLPVFRKSAVASKADNQLKGEPFQRLQGMIFSPFRTSDFFEAAFGPPTLKGETVNFVVSSVEPGYQGNVLYNRFGVTDQDVQPWTTMERRISIFGQQLLLHVYPLQHFYSFADRYLALIVGLCAALVSCMVMIVMRVSQNQLEFETLAKDSSVEAARQSRRQVENLRKLNEFDRVLAGELDIDALILKFTGALSRLAEVDSSFLFFKRSSMAVHLSLKGSGGICAEEFNMTSLPLSLVEKLVTQSLVLHMGDPGSEEILKSLLQNPEKYSDWILSAVSTREGGRCGLVFAARTNGASFTEVDKQLFESMVTQFASGVEIAQLFLRVEDASKAKNAFLANMSHEIRTPLSAIIGFSEMLTHENISWEQRLSVAENLRRNGEQLTCIIDDILDLSKVEAGKLKVDRRQIPLSAIVHEIKSVMDLRAKGRDIRFTIETAGSVPARIETDEVRLKQVLMNIVGNAIKFTDKGYVRLIIRFLQGERGAGCLAFTVKDTGIGIADEAQAELFRPFSQGDMSTTRRFGGSGLGLALSKRLAQELGGDVTLLESIRGQGSTFEIRIDAGDLSGVVWMDSLFPKAVPQGPILPERAPRLDGARILIVEDSEDNQDIFRYFLESSGARPEIVSDGLRAVQEASTKDFDMILMDIQIPGIDGKEATRRIRRHGFKKPIVALTAHAMLEERESCLKAGCSGQITKPVSGEALISQVANFLRRA